QKNREKYATSFVKVSIAAFYYHLNKNSMIKYVNIYDNNTFTTLNEIANRKIKYLSNLRYSETKGSDGLSLLEVQQVLSHKFMDRSTSKRLLR
ncbi:12517_t:CDS:1, partial [Funneliformis caledonium]